MFKLLVVFTVIIICLTDPKDQTNLPGEVSFKFVQFCLYYAKTYDNLTSKPHKQLLHNVIT